MVDLSNGDRVEVRSAWAAKMANNLIKKKPNITLNNFNTIIIMNNKYSQNVYNENVRFVIF